MVETIEKLLVLAKLTPRTALSSKSVTSAIFERFSDKCTLFLKRTIGPWKHLAENLSQGIIKIAKEQNRMCLCFFINIRSSVHKRTLQKFV